MSVPKQLLEFPRLVPRAKARPVSPALGPAADGPVLVATDGSAAANAATRLGALLAARRGTELQALCVVGADAEVGHDIRPAVERELARAGGDIPYRMDRMPGNTGVVTLREAMLREAALIMMGLPRHGAAARPLLEEPTLQVARHARVPVLAVAPGTTALPRRVVVAVDFSRASLHAARVALGLVPDDAVVYLTHVRPAFRDAEEREGLGLIYAQGIAGASCRLRQELRALTPVAMETVVLEGNAPDELLAFADQVDADLIAVGSHRYPTFTHFAIGSVTAALLRRTTRSLLITPPRR